VNAYAAEVAELVEGIVPHDAREADDRAATLAWIAGGAPLCRVAKPDTPPEHLVSYAVAVDPRRQELLLVDHRLAGLWLPTGGHVEPGEHPAVTARRELREELGLVAPPLGGVPGPLMVTRTTTVGRTAGHLDVSLWYPFEVARDRPLAHDAREFSAVRWWAPSAIAHAPGSRFDPELPRFAAKLTRALAPSP
jgi:8-oxo-dGTP pyrophosphatase MutT (NUDIX family)